VKGDWTETMLEALSPRPNEAVDDRIGFVRGKWEALQTGMTLTEPLEPYEGFVQHRLRTQRHSAAAAAAAGPSRMQGRR